MKTVLTTLLLSTCLLLSLLPLSYHHFTQPIPLALSKLVPQQDCNRRWKMKPDGILLASLGDATLEELLAKLK